MPYINVPPSLYEIIKGIETRLLKLETAQRFTLPNVPTDPTYPRIGDMWLNTTTNQMKVVDANGTVRVVSWT
jgi:hypothetical protein